MSRKIDRRQNPALLGMRSRWLVHEGRPSWHQARAGHLSAGATVFSGEDAEREARAYRDRYNHHIARGGGFEPSAWVREEIAPIR